jgi:putative holliday junction resolvase
MGDAAEPGDRQSRPGVRPGVRLGVDVGDARIGVARSDPSGVFATPVETVARRRGDLARIRALAREHDAVEVVVGLPRSLSGADGPSAAKVRRFAARLADAVSPVPVRLCDERLSTVSAEAVLRESGRKGHKRRAVVDQAAAVVILQNALDTERGTGAAPGELVTASRIRPADGVRGVDQRQV